MELSLNKASMTDDQIVSALCAEMHALMPVIIGQGYSLTNKMPLRITRNYSFMFRFSLTKPGTAPQNLLVKIHRKPSMKTLQEAIEADTLRVDAQREFEVLRSFAEAIGQVSHPQLCAIQVVAYLPGFNAIVMQELEMRPFKDFYFELPFFLGNSKYWTALEAHLTLAGELLKIIHTAFGQKQTAPLFSLGGLELVEREFSRLERFIPPSRLTSLRKKFLTFYKLIEDVVLPVAAVHKDYHLGNIFLSQEGKVGVLDPNWEERGAIYEDLARLLIDPVTRKLQIITQGLYFRRASAKRFEKSVLRGYFGSTDVDERLLSFYRALMALTIWRVHEENQLNQGSLVFLIFGGIIRWLFRRYFAKLITGFVNRGLRHTVADIA